MTGGEESEMIACTRPAVIWDLSDAKKATEGFYHFLQLSDHLICGLGSRCLYSRNELIDSQTSIKRFGLEDLAFEHGPHDLIDESGVTVLRG